MRRLLILLIASGVAAVALFGFDSVRNATEQAFGVGQGVLDAGQAAVAAGQQAIEAGQGVVGTASDTADAARQLNGACDLVREAVRPGTPPEDSASLLQQAVAIVGGVVVAYPDVPGMSDLQGALGAAKQALAADPSGQSLGLSSGAVESACSQIPSLP
jgi:hypothetical protein